MSEARLSDAVAAFLYREALLLDQRRWEEWLALYDEDSVFWVPSYAMDGALVTDPELSVNLIYIRARAGLEDRIFRLETGDSIASTPLPHTSHMVTNVLAEEDADGIHATAAFQVATWTLNRGSETRAGRYDYRLRRTEDGFRIRRKKVLTVDEVIDGWFDVISI